MSSEGSFFFVCVTRASLVHGLLRILSAKRARRTISSASFSKRSLPRRLSSSLQIAAQPHSTEHFSSVFYFLSVDENFEISWTFTGIASLTRSTEIEAVIREPDSTLRCDPFHVSTVSDSEFQLIQSLRAINLRLYRLVMYLYQRCTVGPKRQKKTSFSP